MLVFSASRELTATSTAQNRYFDTFLLHMIAKARASYQLFGMPTLERTFVLWFWFMFINHMLCCINISDPLIALAALEHLRIQFFQNEAIDIFSFLVLRVAVWTVFALYRPLVYAFCAVKLFTRLTLLWVFHNFETDAANEMLVN